MNFVWDIVLQAAQDNLESEKLFFKPAENFSPYYEHAFSSINEKHVEKADVEINPLLRFSPIFEYILHPDVIDLIFANQRQCLLFMFDLAVHILAEIDLCHGMTKREFYIRKIRRELLEGVHGEIAREGMEQLNRVQQVAVADELLKVFETGSNLKSFCNIMKQVFQGCIIYQDRKHPQKIYAYIGKERDEQLQKQWRMIRETFLPLDMNVKEFWAEHFGILDIDETLKINSIAIF